MVITLRADNRPLTQNTKWTYLADNYASGVTSLVVEDGSVFAIDDFVIIGEIGNEFTELRRITNISTNTLTVAATSFAHAESTKVAKTPYNQVRFYWTADTTFSLAAPITGVLALTPQFWYTQYDDTVNTTGYAWFVFSNSVTSDSSASTSPIPYANFSRNTVKKAIDGFYSLLNNNEAKLISYDDALEWLSEAYDRAKNGLAMNVDEYDASDGTDTISVVAGTGEYSLPSDFGEMIAVTVPQNLGLPIQPIPIQEVELFLARAVGFTNRYYLRNTKIGFVPTPTTNFTVSFRYKKMAADLTNYYDTIDLPKKAFVAMKDFMMYRAGIKLRRGDYQTFLTIFEAQIAQMRLQANNRDNSLDMIGPKRTANV